MLNARSRPDTQGGLTNGKQAVEATPFQASLALDWDTPYVKGLGVMGRGVYNGQVISASANTPRCAADAFRCGTRHTFDRTDGKPVTLRANVINLFDANYWIATSTFFFQNPPRTFLLSLTADFSPSYGKATPLHSRNPSAPARWSCASSSSFFGAYAASAPRWSPLALRR